MKKKQILEVKQKNNFNQRLYLLAAILVIVIAVKYIASDLIAPILLAGMFSVLLTPIFNLYKKRGLSSGISLILMIFTVVLGTFGLIVALQYAFGLINESITAALKSVDASLTNGSLFGFVSPDLNQAVGSFLTPEMATAVIGKIASSFSSLVLYFILIPVLAVLLVSQVDSFSDQFKDELNKTGPSLAKFKKFSESVRSYIIGRFKVNLATSLMITLALMILGVDYAIMWGLLTLILCFIPYIGIFIAGTGPFLIMLANGGASGAALLIVVYFIITTITENFIDPLIQGKQNRLTTASLVIGFLFWSWLFGILGTIISAPMTVMLKSVLEDYDETRWIALLMVGDYSKAPKDTKSVQKLLSSLRRKIPQIRNI